MPELILTQSVEFTSSEPWPDDVKLYQPFEVEQLLLPDAANSRAVQAYLKMCELHYGIEQRANAEYMSPTGQIPFVKCGPFVVSELEPIVAFVAQKGIVLSSGLTDAQIADKTAYMSLVNNVLHLAELYVCWCEDETFHAVTSGKYSFSLPWPLNKVLTWRKRKEIIKKLHSMGWGNKDQDEVRNEVETCIQALSERLGDQKFFFGNSPTELDALVYGHVSAILTTPLPDDSIASIVRQYERLLQHCNEISARYFHDNTDYRVRLLDYAP